jgi:hypothetical protein
MVLKTLSAITLLLATTTANALAIDPQAPCALPAPDPYGALLNVAAARAANSRSSTNFALATLSR